MTKFKVGDKVRIIQIVNHGDFPVGYVGVITSIDEKPYLYCIDDLWYYDDEELEIFEPVCKETIEKSSSDGGSTSYYQFPEGTKELFDLINHRNMNFAVGNIFKACYRLGQKQGVDDLYDLRKIIFMAEQEIKRIQNS